MDKNDVHVATVTLICMFKNKQVYCIAHLRRFMYLKYYEATKSSKSSSKRGNEIVFVFLE